MPTIIYTTEIRKPKPMPQVQSSGVITYAHDDATGKVKATRK